MLIPRIVPWLDWSEWFTVRRGVLSLHSTHRIEAVEIITMWRSRGKVPHAVESCGQLTEVQINDFNGQVTNNNIDSSPDIAMIYRSENELRLQYSLAIIRTVNGLVDQSQNGFYADSVLNLSEQLGIPGWIVEIRHEATHNQLPSLVILRSACQYLLDWIESNYWKPQELFLQEIRTRYERSFSNDTSTNINDQNKDENKNKEDNNAMALKVSHIAALNLCMSDSMTCPMAIFGPTLFNQMMMIKGSEEEHKIHMTRVWVGLSSLLTQMQTSNAAFPIAIISNVLQQWIQNFLVSNNAERETKMEAQMVVTIPGNQENGNEGEEVGSKVEDAGVIFGFQSNSNTTMRDNSQLPWLLWLRRLCIWSLQVMGMDADDRNITNMTNNIDEEDDGKDDNTDPDTHKSKKSKFNSKTNQKNQIVGSDANANTDVDVDVDAESILLRYFALNELEQQLSLLQQQTSKNSKGIQKWPSSIQETLNLTLEALYRFTGTIKHHLPLPSLQ